MSSALPPDAQATTAGGDVNDDPGEDDSGDEEEEEELAVQAEWVEAGVAVDGEMPNGEPLPQEGGEQSSGLGPAEPFAKAGISEFVSAGLGMGADWGGGR